MYKIFVFGTLKEGFPNYQFNVGERLFGEFETVLLHSIYLIGKRYSPWMVENPSAGTLVQGQAFQVDDAALAVMDALERINEPDGYQRVEIMVRNKSIALNKSIPMYAYMKRPAQLTGMQVMSEALSNYSLIDAARYRSRSDSIEMN